MLDGISVDQLRTFIAAVDEGSFSAAGRRLRRAQSVVSATLANLEAQVGFPLFDRTGRYPTLTEAGVGSVGGGVPAFTGRSLPGGDNRIAAASSGGMHLRIPSQRACGGRCLP